MKARKIIVDMNETAHHNSLVWNGWPKIKLPAGTEIYFLPRPPERLSGSPRGTSLRELNGQYVNVINPPGSKFQNARSFTSTPLYIVLLGRGNTFTFYIAFKCIWKSWTRFSQKVLCFYLNMGLYEIYGYRERPRHLLYNENWRSTRRLDQKA
jgi:hypothetical protein